MLIAAGTAGPRVGLRRTKCKGYSPHVCQDILIELPDFLSYRDRIQDLLAEIQADAESVLQENEEGIVNLMDLVSAFVKAIAPLQSDDESDIFDNTVSDDRYADELERLKYLYIQQEEDRLRSKLEEFDFVIDEPATLTYVIGQPRVELVSLMNFWIIVLFTHPYPLRKSIMPLVYLWLGRVHTLVNRAREENLGDDDSDALSTVATMVTILWTYNDRVTELIRVWRQQRMNVSAQIRCFCGGIFNSWYEEVTRTRAWRNNEISDIHFCSHKILTIFISSSSLQSMKVTTMEITTGQTTTTIATVMAAPKGKRKLPRRRVNLTDSQSSRVISTEKFAFDYHK